MKLTHKVGDKRCNNDSGGAAENRTESLLVLPERSPRPGKADLNEKQHRQNGNKTTENRKVCSLFPPYFTYHVSTDKSDGESQYACRNKKTENSDDFVCQHRSDGEASDKNTQKKNI